jgi:hypothetical protein
MPSRRTLLAIVALFILALAWNGVVHLVVLRDANASVQHLRRPDLADKSWLGILMTLGVVTMFVWGYPKMARTGTLQEGLSYGLAFALLAGLLVDLNQYVLFPIPGAVALKWFMGGVVEFCLYGASASRLCPPPAGT